MGEKGNTIESIPAGATSGGSSLLGQAGSATANIVLDTGKTLRGKVVEGAAEGAAAAGRERLRRRGQEPEPPTSDDDEATQA